MNFYKKMKRFFALLGGILFFTLSMYTFPVYSFDINSIKLTDTPNEENTELNIKGAQVVEKYLLNYKKELESFQTLYSLEKDTILNKNIQEISAMIFGLRKIQTNKVEKADAEKVMSVYIERIKELNQNLKMYLKNTAESSKTNTKNYQDSLYKKYILKVSKNLDTVISVLKKKTAGKRILSKQETLYNQKISSLEVENKKLKNFDKLFFKNKRELLFSLRNILGKIKKELKTINTLQ